MTGNRAASLRLALEGLSDLYLPRLIRRLRKSGSVALRCENARGSALCFAGGPAAGPTLVESCFGSARARSKLELRMYPPHILKGGSLHARRELQLDRATTTGRRRGADGCSCSSSQRREVPARSSPTP